MAFDPSLVTFRNLEYFENLLHASFCALITSLGSLCLLSGGIIQIIAGRRSISFQFKIFLDFCHVVI